MRKRLLAGAFAGLALLGTACGEKDAGKVDLDQPEVKGDVIPKSFEAVSPDSVTVFLNIDSHPSVVRLCLEGVAFRTVSDHYVSLATSAVERVPEWDAYCASQK